MTMWLFYFILVGSAFLDFSLSAFYVLPAIFSTWLYHFAFFFILVFFLMVFVIK